MANGRSGQAVTVVLVGTMPITDESSRSRYCTDRKAEDDDRSRSHGRILETGKVK